MYISCAVTNSTIHPTAQEWTNRTLAVHERVNGRFLVLPGSLSIFDEITGHKYLVNYDLAVKQYIKVGEILYLWPLSLASFRSCETQYLHFTTRVFGHSAISLFLGGQGSFGCIIGLFGI